MNIPVTSRTALEAPPSEREKVEGWRLKCLVEAGYPVEVAEKVARDPHVDLHRACRIVKQGCAPELAAQILL